MKTKIYVFLIVLFSFSVCFSACNSTGKNAAAATETTAQTTYEGPMDKEITSNKPGKCSKCGMDLVEKKAEAVKK